MKTLIASAVLALFAAGASATVSGPSIVAYPGNTAVISGSGAVATSSGNGSSVSRASNVSGAYASGAQGSTSGGNSFASGGAAGVVGNVGTGSASTASNHSTGSATGGAAAGGLATAEVGGVAAYSAPKSVSGIAFGGATSTTGNAVIAGKNTNGWVASGNVAGYDAGAASGQLGYGAIRAAGTTAGAYSTSGVTGGNHGAVILNTNGGTAAAGAVAKSGNIFSSVSAD